MSEDLFMTRDLTDDRYPLLKDEVEQELAADVAFFSSATPTFEWKPITRITGSGVTSVWTCFAYFPDSPELE